MNKDFIKEKNHQNFLGAINKEIDNVENKNNTNKDEELNYSVDVLTDYEISILLGETKESEKED